jgi:hypothetical protein
MVSFHNLHTFCHYNDFVAAIGPDDKLRKEVNWLIQESLCQDLRMSNQNTIPSIHKVTSLVLSPIGHHLSSFQGVNTVKHFSSWVMDGAMPFGIKLCFLGNLYAKFVSRQWAKNTRDSESHILICIKNAWTDVESTGILEQTFHAATDSPWIFCCERKETVFLPHVSNLLCCKKECQAILNYPTFLWRLSLEEMSSIGGEKHTLALLPYDELAKRSKDHSRLHSGRTGTTTKRLDALIKRFLE